MDNFKFTLHFHFLDVIATLKFNFSLKSFQCKIYPYVKVRGCLFVWVLEAKNANHWTNMVFLYSEASNYFGGGYLQSPREFYLLVLVFFFMHSLLFPFFLFVILYFNFVKYTRCNMYNMVNKNIFNKRSINKKVFFYYSWDISGF